MAVIWAPPLPETSSLRIWEVIAGSLVTRTSSKPGILNSKGCSGNSASRDRFNLLNDAFLITQCKNKFDNRAIWYRFAILIENYTGFE